MADSEQPEHPIDKANRILWERQCEADGVKKEGVSRELAEWVQKRRPRIVEAA